MEKFNSNDLVENVKQRLQGPLPGLDAQMLMSRFGRTTEVALNAKLAAVMLVLFHQNDEPHFLLTKRTNTNSGDRHSGQISFPGGSKDPEDRSLTETAFRETHEEVGISKDSLELIGSLSPLYIPVSNFHVHPFVSYHPNGAPQYRLQQSEVASTIEASIDLLFHPNTIKTTEINLGNGMILKDIPYFDIRGHIVWGATAMMLSEFKVMMQKF